MSLFLALCAAVLSFSFGLYLHDSWAILLAAMSTPWALRVARQQGNLLYTPSLFSSFTASFLASYTLYFFGLIANFSHRAMWSSIVFAYIAAGTYYVLRDVIKPIVSQPSYARDTQKAFAAVFTWLFILIFMVSTLPYRAVKIEIAKNAISPILVFTLVFALLRLI